MDLLVILSISFLCHLPKSSATLDLLVTDNPTSKCTSYFVECYKAGAEQSDEETISGCIESQPKPVTKVRK